VTFSATRLDRLPAAERGLTIGDFLVPIAVAERISTAPGTSPSWSSARS